MTSGYLVYVCLQRRISFLGLSQLSSDPGNLRQCQNGQHQKIQVELPQLLQLRAQTMNPIHIKWAHVYMQSGWPAPRVRVQHCRSPCDVVSCCNNVDYAVPFCVCVQDLAEIIETRKKDPDDSAGPRKKSRVTDDSSLDKVTCLLVVTTCPLPTLLDSGHHRKRV